MGSLAWNIFVAFKFVVLLFCVKDSKTNEEVIEGIVSSTMDITRRDMSMPSFVSLNISLGGKDIALRLVRDEEATLDFPVYILSTDSSGTFHSHRATLHLRDFGVYHEIQHKATFSVLRDVMDNLELRLTMEGIVYTDGKMYELRRTERNNQPLLRQDDAITTLNGFFQNREQFTVRVLEPTSSDQFDAILLPPVNEKSEDGIEEASAHEPQPVLQPRQMRELESDINLDVVAIADFATYSDWYNRSVSTDASAKEQETLEKILQYYAFVFSGINTMYESINSRPYIIHARLAGIIVATNTSSSPWTEKFRQKGDRRDEVDAYLTLPDLVIWAVNNSDILPLYDHIMLFTGLNLTSWRNGTKSGGIVGLAYVNTLCAKNGYATSLVEDLGGFQSIRTAAHELGHGFSARHDGTNNSCKAEDRYIMADTSYPETEQNKYNPWIFSPCSADYFHNFVITNVDTVEGAECLYRVPNNTFTIPNVTSLMPGQIYNVDNQCRQYYGPGSRNCRTIANRNASEICTSNYCYDPTTTSTCFKRTAARGTSCGNQKWCINGKCTFDKDAPVVDDNCVFGDQLGVVYQGQDCATVISSNSSYCSDPNLLSRCCQTCAQVKEQSSSPHATPVVTTKEVFNLTSNTPPFTTKEVFNLTSNTPPFTTKEVFNLTANTPPFTTKEVFNLTTNTPAVTTIIVGCNNGGVTLTNAYSFTTRWIGVREGIISWIILTITVVFFTCGQ